ncbi:MAG: MBL fold metallo-hydrolase [Gemmatimonadales bacterium]
MTLRRIVGPAICGCLLIVAPLRAQRDSTLQDVEIKTVPVAGGIYMLQGRGGNIGLSVGEDGAFVIDDEFAPLSERIMAAIGKVTDKPVRFLINTHWHGDHTGGNENFGQAGAIIVAHENVRKRLNPEEFKDVVGRTKQVPPDALPVVTFTDAIDFYWNGERIHVVHVNQAHTDGDAVVHFVNANVVHMGDTFFNGRYPFIDTESGGSINGVIHAVELVLAHTNSATRFIPGHGDLSGPDAVRAYRDMLIKVRDRVRAMVNDGKSEDEVVAAKPTADLDAVWGEKPERFVRGVYKALAGG